MKRILAVVAMLLGCAAVSMADGYNYVEPGQFKQWLEYGRDVAIVDIQVPSEFQKKHFKGSLETNAYPVKTAGDKQKLDAVLPILAATQNDIVVICPRGGGGAQNTYDYLKEKGISEKRLLILKDGMQGWPYKELTVQTTKEGFQIITSEQLKSLLEEKKGETILIDARTAQEYQEAHIHSAISIPLNVLEKDSSTLAAAKDARLVFYCNGVKCGKSAKSALIARSLGYTDISIYAEGMPVWEEKGYPFYSGADYDKTVKASMIKPVVVKALLDNAPSTLTVVDARDAREYAEGHVPGAINIPLETFAAGSGVLDKGKQIVVYCNSGGRSYNAYRKLQKLAYPNIAQMLFADWQAEKLPVAK
ncbi:MAG: rhodanese-like domain-containing protein [Deltaproteobacteria bacterium]|nr:rhodanese-like domain-containing protein [Deltaproteobacteria bacterium]